MATGKYVKVGGIWKPVTAEYVKVGGVMKPVSANWVKIGGTWKGIPFAKYLFACEQSASQGLFGLDDAHADLAGWPVYGSNLPADAVEVACDSDGNSYWIGHDAAGITGVVVKRNLAGVVQPGWPKSLASRGISICVDADGRVYTGEEQGTVSRFNSDGSLEWTKTINSGYTIRALAVDYSAGFLYAATGSGFDGAYRLSTSTGGYARIWTSLYGDVSGIAIDEASPTSLYIGTDNGYLAKISAAGYEYWNSGGPIRASADIHCVRVGHDGYGYCATGIAKTIEKFVLSSGSLSWVAPPTGGAGTCSYGCAPDQFGNVYGTWYIAGTSPNNLLKKIKSTGVVDWSWQPYTSAQMFGVAVTPGIRAAGF